MQAALLDSDILSEILKGKDAQVDRRQREYLAQFAKLSFTSVTVLEILFGLERIGAKAQIQRAETLLAKNDEVVPSSEDYRLAASIAGALDRQGTPIGLIDPMIAACAMRRGYSVVSGNTAHFESIRRAGYTFALEDWRKP